MAPSLSVHWHEHFYVLHNFFFEFRQWLSRDDRDLNLTRTSNFYCLGALGVGPGARTWPHVLAWLMGSDYSYRAASEQKCLKRHAHSFSLNYWKYWKNGGPRSGVFNPHPPDLSWPSSSYVRSENLNQNRSSRSSSTNLQSSSALQSYRAKFLLTQFLLNAHQAGHCPWKNQKKWEALRTKNFKFRTELQDFWIIASWSITQ